MKVRLKCTESVKNVDDIQHYHVGMCDIRQTHVWQIRKLQVVVVGLIVTHGGRGNA